jgi:hypothetical protein
VMNSKIRYAVFAAITIGILLTIAFTLSSPQIYSVQNDPSSTSRFHANVEALKQQSLNSTTDIDPDLQDMINLAGPISLNIRIHNFEEASRDLERFGKSQASLKNLVVRLDMDESEIQDLQKNTALQKQILTTLLNTSLALDDLQSMEIQYYSQSNQEMQIPFRLRGSELRKKVQGLNQRYRTATENVNTVSKKFGISTPQNEESATHVDQIVNAIAPPESSAATTAGNSTPASGTTARASGNQTPSSGSRTSAPGSTTPALKEDRLSLVLRPDTGRYQDPIEYSGISLGLDGSTTQRSESNPVILYMDDQPFANAVTDKFGFYSVKIPISKNQSGSHTVYSKSPTARSVNRSLTVLTVNSVVQMMVSDPDTKGNVTVGGIVTANNVPVSSAPVQISWDQSHATSTTTDEDGYFMKEISLPTGPHTIVAGFSGIGYPISNSESNPQVVDVPFFRGIPLESEQVWPVIIIVGALTGLIGGVILYLRRRKKTAKTPTAALENAKTPVIQKPDPKKTPEMPREKSIYEVMEYGNEPVHSGINLPSREEGSRTVSWAASRGVYQHMTGQAARLLSGSQGKPEKTPEKTSCRATDSDPDNDTPNIPVKFDDETLLGYYNRILNESGLAAASWGVYQHIAGKIARDFQILHYKSMTAREISRTCQGKPYCGAFSRFITTYERIHYGGTDTTDEQAKFEAALTSTEERMNGETK